MYKVFNINYQTCTNILVVASFMQILQKYLKDPYSLAIHGQSFVCPINDIAKIYILYSCSTINLSPFYNALKCTVTVFNINYK